jgi:hypothetical protein
VGECAYFELYGTSGMVIQERVQVTRCSRLETVAWSLYSSLVSNLMIKNGDPVLLHVLFPFQMVDSCINLV